jgi:hypothetical protein
LIGLKYIFEGSVKGVRAFVGYDVRAVDHVVTLVFDTPLKSHCESFTRRGGGRQQDNSLVIIIIIRAPDAHEEQSYYPQQTKFLHYIPPSSLELAAER